MKYNDYKLTELKEFAKNMNLSNYSKLNKEDLITLIKKSNKPKKGGVLISYENNIKNSGKSVNNKIQNILNSNNPNYIKKELMNNQGHVFLNTTQTKTEILKKLSNKLSNNKNKNIILKIKEKLTGAPLKNFVKYELLDWIPINKINWSYLSKNPNAIELLKENEDKIDWYYLSLSRNPNAIELLKENKDKIDWHNLSINLNAIELLKENQDKIDWVGLSSNPNIFKIKYNYNKMKQKRNETGIPSSISKKYINQYY